MTRARFKVRVTRCVRMTRRACIHMTRSRLEVRVTWRIRVPRRPRVHMTRSRLEVRVTWRIRVPRRPRVHMTRSRLEVRRDLVYFAWPAVPHSHDPGPVQSSREPGVFAWPGGPAFT